MPAVAKKPKPPAADSADAPKRRRNTIFVTLDDATEARLQKFIDAQRVKPDRAAVALTALIEFLDRVEADG